MKTNKTESQKKSAKKADKKALEKNLTEKLFEAVKSLGHDAERIGEDLVLVSKFVAKKISKRMQSAKVKEQGQKTGNNKPDETPKKTKNASKKSKVTQEEVLPATTVTAEEPPVVKPTKKLNKQANSPATPAKKTAVKAPGAAGSKELKTVKSSSAKKPSASGNGGDKEPVN